MELSVYEGFMEIIADELNVKKVSIYRWVYTEQDGSEGKLEVAYLHDTVRGGGRLVALKQGTEVNAPRTIMIACEAFLARKN